MVSFKKKWQKAAIKLFITLHYVVVLTDGEPEKGGEVLAETRVHSRFQEGTQPARKVALKLPFCHLESPYLFPTASSFAHFASE